MLVIFNVAFVLVISLSSFNPKESRDDFTFVSDTDSEKTYRGNDETISAHTMTELQSLKMISYVHYMKLKNTYDIMLCEKIG